MKLEIDEYKIRLSGTANISRPLKEDSCVDLTVGAVDVVDVTNPVNNNGTKNQIFKLKISEKSEINIISEKDIIRAVRKGSQSKLQRYLIEQLAEKYDEEPEVYYIKRMTENISKLKKELE